MSDQTGVPLPQLVFGTTDDVHGSMGGKVTTPNIGATVFGRYKLIRVLGRGGMGVVWLADDLKLERPIALKFLPSLDGLNPSAVNDLKIETRRGLELSHPNIVRIYDFIDDENSVAISMEYIDGKTLSQMRRASPTGVFSAEEIRSWLVGVCEALDYAHFQRRLIHRDLTPSNIMLCGEDAIAKITDFGIACTFSGTMSRLAVNEASIRGTLRYMSPQQVMGDHPLPTDDVYSLGATIYELFTGMPPFFRGDVSTQIHSKIPPAIAKRREELEVKDCVDVPKLWEEAISLCLSKDPSQRPQSAGALAAMLELKPRTIGTTLPTSYSSGRTAPLAKKSHKTPLYVVTAVVIVAVAGAVFMFSGEKAPSSASVPVTVMRELVAPQPIIPEPASLLTPDALGAPTIPTATPASLPPTNVSVTPPPSMVQIPVLEPLNGFWTLDQMFPVPPQADYSENGRRRLLFEAQQLLKEKGLYSATLDGMEGKGTHNAIVLFQAKNGISPTGLLDGLTLAAMALTTEPDTAEWKPPVSVSSSGKRNPIAKEEPNFFQRTGKSIGRLFKRD